MGFWYWFRVVMMSIGLVLCILAIRNLNQTSRSGGGNSLTAALTGERTAKVAQAISICPTRVARLEAGKVSIFQEGMSWYRATPARKEKLDDVAVEKWFSRNCSVSGTRVSSPSQVDTALKIFFVSGMPRTLLRSAGGEYEWMGLPFRSNQMDDALKELTELPVKEPAQ